jgi:hypothetical protein
MHCPRRYGHVSIATAPRGSGTSGRRRRCLAPAGERGNPLDRTDELAASAASSSAAAAQSSGIRQSHRQPIESLASRYFAHHKRSNGS